MYSIFLLLFNLTNNLSWNIHIDKITKKANRSLGFLRKNFRISNTSVKSNAYTLLVRPHLFSLESVHQDPGQQRGDGTTPSCEVCLQQVPQHQHCYNNARPTRLGDIGRQENQGTVDHVLQDHQ